MSPPLHWGIGADSKRKAIDFFSGADSFPEVSAGRIPTPGAAVSFHGVPPGGLSQGANRKWTNDRALEIHKI